MKTRIRQMLIERSETMTVDHIAMATLTSKETLLPVLHEMQDQGTLMMKNGNYWVSEYGRGKSLKTRIAILLIEKLSAPGDQCRICDPQEDDIRKLQIAVHQCKPGNWKVKTWTDDDNLYATRVGSKS